MRDFEYEELRKATKDFSNSQIIGKGSHGCIYKGSLEDGQVVAIKRSSLGLQSLEDNSKLENEASILSSIPKTRNVVNLLGTSQDSAKSTQMNNKVCSVQMLVMEYMPNGTLHDLLHSNNYNPRPLILFTWEKRLEIALQIAKALQFIHSLKPKVIHRDIKSTNILLNNVLSPKLIDFGLAVRVHDDVEAYKLGGQVDPLTQPAGTIGYLDPCYTTPCKLSTNIDIYSFGVVLFEIITGQKVIDTSRSTTSLVEWVLPLIKERKFSRIFDRKMLLPRYMEEVIMQFLGIAVRCVSSNVNLRPSSDEIVSEMENCYYNVQVQRMRLPIWVKFIRGFVILKRRGRNCLTTSKKRAKNVTTIKCVACQRGVPQHGNEVPLRRLLLRDFLINDHPL